jgi:hypothetical protein
MPLIGPGKPYGSNIEWYTSALNTAENVWTEEGLLTGVEETA